MSNQPLLAIRDLTVQFDTDSGPAVVVDNVGFDIGRGQTYALVGESGCGKSTTALAILRLIPEPPGRIVSGKICFADPNEDSLPIDLTTLPTDRLRTIRGRRIAIVFQEPGSALNPVLTIGEQIAEPLMWHENKSRTDAMRVARDLLGRVGIAPAEERLHAYPHQLSGGMQQRAMIAMALACRPAVLIADEPTTALDVTVQAQILDLLKDLQRTTGLGLLFISHDLGVVARVADRVGVMYAGRIVEEAPIERIFTHPAHPYTQALLRSLPKLGPRLHRLETIEGVVPDPSDPPQGCRFHPRCTLTQQLARDGERKTQKDRNNRTVLRRCIASDATEAGGTPALREIAEDHRVACWEVDAAAVASETSAP